MGAPPTRRSRGAFLDRLASSMQQLCSDLSEGVAVAVSGGVDSTVLLRSLHQLGVPLIALHVDHGLRAEAKADAAFVAELARELGTPFRHLRVTVGAGNRQHEAREARYAALAEAAWEHGCAVVATGHTANDQAETVVMNLIRGAGLRGLAGMPRHRRLQGRLELIRPLLWATREDVEAEAERQGWTWRNDASNATDAYQRNRIRDQVLPLLEAEGGAGTVQRMAASADAARAALPRLDDFALATGLGLDLERLRGAQDRLAVWVEAVAEWCPEVRRTTNLLRQLDGLVEGQVGRCVPVGDCVAWHDRDAIRFVVPVDPIEQEVTVGETVRTRLGRLTLEPMWGVQLNQPVSPISEHPFDPQRSVLLDADVLVGTLRLRTWRAGDRIAPSGMKGTKLVSDVLTDRRVRPSDRDRQLVLCVGGRVAWLIGIRIAHWAGATEHTQRVVRAMWDPRVSVGSQQPHP